MDLGQIVKSVQEKDSTITSIQVEEIIQEMGYAPDQIAPNMIGAIANRIKEKSGKGLAFKSHQLAPRSPSSELGTQRPTPPITRTQRSKLEKANRIDLKIGDTSGERKDAAIEFIKSEVAKIDDQFDSVESERARDLVDQVLPAFAEWRAKQSPDNIALHISAYGEEVAEDLLPKFRSYSQALSTDLREVAASVISDFGAA